MTRIRALIGFTLTIGIFSCGSDVEHYPSPSDATAGDGSNDAHHVTCPFERPLEFGRNGIVEEPGVLDRVVGCLDGTRFSYTRWQQDYPKSGIFGVHCWADPAPCGPSSALAAVHEAMADPVVAAALSEAPPAVYGLDRRNENDAMYMVRAGADCSRSLRQGSGFDVGAPCEEGTPDCRAIPPAIEHFVDRVKELERQKDREPHCIGINPRDF